MKSRTRVYKTKKLSDGSTIVSSKSTSDSLIYDFFKACFKFLFKAIIYICFFYIVIPIKLLKKK